jgi:DNA-binding FadR family transcriptional regulator
MMKERTYPRRGLHGAVVHEIGTRILRGELLPGDTLPSEEELGGEPGISRTVIREAVKVLAAKGLVVSRPKTGTHVRERRFWNLMDPDVLAWRLEAEPNDAFFLDVFELRRLIEPAAARLAAERASAEEIEALTTAYEAMAAAGVDDPDAYLAADVTFHAIILEACHNELLGHLGSTLRAVFRATFTRTIESARETAPMHGVVLEGIAARDPDKAERIMRDLIDRTATYLAPTSEAVA